MKKEKKVKKKTSLFILYVASFILALSTAIPAYINSSFIESFVGVKYVGYFFIISNILLLFFMLKYPKTIKRIGNFISTQAMVFINFLSLFFLIFSSNTVILLISFVGMWVSSQLIWNNMDIFVESFTSDISTGKTRAIFFTFMNLGWICSPFIASKLVVNDNNYNAIYIMAALCLIVYYTIIILNKKRVSKEVKYNEFCIKDTISLFWKNSNLRGLYFSSFFLNLFYSTAVVYLPIYLHNTIGFNWTVLGIMFSLILIPFVLVEIPAGIMADKKWGEKELMSVGFVILIISLILFFTTKSASPLIWGAILFFSRIGAALIESMRESRFFKIIDVEDVSHINFLRTSYPLGYIIGPLLASLILSFYEIQYLFLFIAVLFLYTFYFVYIIKDSK
jgi:MFS family permease